MAGLPRRRRQDPAVPARRASWPTFIASGEENDLSDHPAWGYVQKLTPDQLRPAARTATTSTRSTNGPPATPTRSTSPRSPTSSTWSPRSPTAATTARCAASSRTPRPTSELVDEDNSYQGKDGRKRWNELGDTIAETWERAIAPRRGWLSWQGDFTDTDLDAETVWDRVGAEPIEIVAGRRRTYLTVRGRRHARHRGR